MTMSSRPTDERTQTAWTNRSSWSSVAKNESGVQVALSKWYQL